MTGPLSTTGVRTILGATAAAPAQPIDRKREQLKQAANAFEAVFLRQMIGAMRQANLGEDLLGSSATDQFREMSDARVADDMAKSGGFGIARMLLARFDTPASANTGASTNTGASAKTGSGQ